MVWIKNKKIRHIKEGYTGCTLHGRVIVTQTLHSFIDPSHYFRIILRIIKYEFQLQNIMFINVFTAFRLLLLNLHYTAVRFKTFFFFLQNYI